MYAGVPTTIAEGPLDSASVRASPKSSRIGRERFVEHDIRRLHVAVDRADRVGMVERIGQRGDDLGRLLVGRLALAEPVAEGDPRHEVGDDETSAVLDPDVVDRDDPRVLEPGQPLRFQEEEPPCPARSRSGAGP